MQKLLLWGLTTVFLLGITIGRLNRDCRLYRVSVSFERKVLVGICIILINSLAVFLSGFFNIRYELVLGLGLLPVLYYYFKFSQWAVEQWSDSIESNQESDDISSPKEYKLWLYISLVLLALLVMVVMFPAERLHLLVRYVPGLLFMIGIIIWIKMKKKN